LGLSIAVPIGPIATLCISRTLARGPVAGIMTGLGSSTVHAAYGTAAVLGGEAARESLHVHAGAMHVLGGLLLCFVGLLMLKRTFAPPILQQRSGGFGTDYTSAAAIAMFNPMTLAMFVAGLSAFETEAANPVELVCGIVLGSASWYGVMALFIAAVGHRLPIGIVHGINRTAALAVWPHGRHRGGRRRLVRTAWSSETARR
jgi:threonine/homoserine/homoserine lactone efflux protein